MCHFILLALPEKADVDRVRQILEKYRRKLDEVAYYDRVEGDLRASENLYQATWGHCDCGTVLGSRRQEDSDIEHLLDKVRRKGWSRAKIDRWLGDKRKAATKREDQAEVRTKPDLDGWVELLHEVLSTQASRSVGVLLTTRGGRESTLNIRRRVRRGVDQAREVLPGAEEFVLYEFVPRMPK